jgi:hypothetical protein
MTAVMVEALTQRFGLPDDQILGLELRDSCSGGDTRIRLGEISKL